MLRWIRQTLLLASDGLGAWPWTVRFGPAAGLRLVAPLRRFKGYCLGQHEPHVVACLAEHLRPASVALDIGSHLGFFALTMVRLVTSTGRVYAFEPLPENAVRLARTLERNQLGNVHLVTRALGQTTGRGVLEAPANESMAHVSAELPGVTPSRGTVPLIRLDDWLEEPGAARRIDLIKIDVEGNELAVLRGAEQVLRRFAPKLIIELHWCLGLPTRPSQVVTWLRERDYELRFIRPVAKDSRNLEDILAKQADQEPPKQMVAFHVFAEPSANSATRSKIGSGFVESSI